MTKKRSSGQVPTSGKGKEQGGDRLRDGLAWPRRKSEQHKAVPYLYDLKKKTRVSRPLRLLVFLAGLGLLVLGLSMAFPATKFSDPYLVRGLLIAGIFGGILAFYSRSSIYRLMRAAGAWIVIIMLLAGFYLFQSDFSSRFVADLVPGHASTRDDGSLIVRRAENGHFMVRSRINGVAVPMLVDTGASNIVLSPTDARRVGIRPGSLNFNNIATTANGDVAFAYTTVDQLQIGDLILRNVEVTVNGTAMDGSLLGLSLLDRLSSYQISGDTLILRP